MLQIINKLSITVNYCLTRKAPCTSPPANKKRLSRQLRDCKEGEDAQAGHVDSLTFPANLFKVVGRVRRGITLRFRDIFGRIGRSVRRRRVVLCRKRLKVAQERSNCRCRRRWRYWWCCRWNGRGAHRGRGDGGVVGRCCRLGNLWRRCGLGGLGRRRGLWRFRSRRGFWRFRGRRRLRGLCVWRRGRLGSLCLWRGRRLFGLCGFRRQRVDDRGRRRRHGCGRGGSGRGRGGGVDCGRGCGLGDGVGARGGGGGEEEDQEERKKKAEGVRIH
ncbi:hypothetical protein DFJ73DRAFT_940488, partial [Zopfochytrium polystomum]